MKGNLSQYLVEIISYNIKYMKVFSKTNEKYKEKNAHGIENQ